MKTIAGGVVAVLARESERRGFDLCAALRADGVPAQTLEDIEGRIPLAALDRALEPLAAPDPTGFALGAIEHGALAGRAYYHYLTANAADVRDYLELSLRYGRLLSDGALLRARYAPDSVTVDHVLVEPAARPQAALAVARVAWITGFVLRARVFSGGAFTPSSLRIAAPPPRQPRALQALFGLEPEFGSQETSVRFPRAALDLPFASADATLRAVLAVRAQAQLEALPPTSDVYGSVKSAVYARLREGDASLQAVASALGLAPRTLQERLRSAGISFRRVVDESRMELALMYLERADLRVADVAYSLGFESPSAFARWYRRATGRSPARLRRH